MSTLHGLVLMWFDAKCKLSCHWLNVLWQCRVALVRQDIGWHWLITVRCRYNAVNFLPNPYKIHPIARPITGKVWDVFCGFELFDLYSASDPAVIYAIPCYIGPLYNGTRLYDISPGCTNWAGPIVLYMEQEILVITRSFFPYTPTIDAP